MSVGAPSAASAPARMWERLGNPLEWNDVHKVLIILSAAAGFLLVWGLSSLVLKWWPIVAGLGALGALLVPIAGLSE